jgi:nitrogen fixation NifU-like protein
MLEDLYQEIILDHNKNPHNFRQCDFCTHKAHGDNLLCGDQYDLFFQVDENGLIVEASFIGTGCAISKASASILVSSIPNMLVQDAIVVAKEFREYILNFSQTAWTMPEYLKPFSQIYNYPARVKCATMPWHIMIEALSSPATA